MCRLDLGYISQNYLSRTFRKKTDRPLAQYMLKTRVEKARKLLQSDMSVKNVTLQTEYGSFSYLSKVFRDVGGRSFSLYLVGKLRHLLEMEVIKMNDSKHDPAYAV